MKKFCLDCGSSLKGRSDKKFCTDLCRNNYHNRRNQSTNNYVRRINYALRKNRRILEQFSEMGQDRITKNILVREGFDFNYVTRVVRKGNSALHYFCYDQGYRELGNDLVELTGQNE